MSPQFEKESHVGLTCLTKVDIPRIMHGQRQSVGTLINEETLLFAKYLRGENAMWIPRVVSSSFTVGIRLLQLQIL